MNNEKISKCLKSYLSGKKYINTDIDKSFKYFKQCAFLVDNIKNNNDNINEELNNIITETDVECNKYITSTLLKKLELSIDLDNSKFTEENEILEEINENEEISENKEINENENDNNELFKIIETGELTKLNNLKYLKLNLFNEIGLTPLHYAIKCGDTSFLKQMFKLGGKIDQTNLFGHTLLEYACLEKDPNIINFLLLFGADIKKHLILRKYKNFFNKGSQIDITLLEIYIINTPILYTKIKYINNIFDNININISSIEYINDNIKTIISIDEFILKLDNLLDILHIDYRNTFINIIKEELDYKLLNKLGCPDNFIEILLYNLVPFINYNLNLRLDWLITQEIFYIIYKICKTSKINIKNLKNSIFELLYNKYIINNIIPIGMIKFLFLQCINKIKI